MSFSVDLWNGFDVIKNQVFSVQKKIKTIFKVITSYQAIESNYNKSLENLYKEFKDMSNSDYLLDKSYIKILEIFQYENQNRKIMSAFMNSLIIEPLSEYLRQPNIFLNKCFSDNISNEENFKRYLNLLKEKQSNYYKECKELSVLLAQNEMDEINSINSGKIAKNKMTRINEKLNRVNTTKKEYMDFITETNKEREKYNQRTEEILNKLEKTYETVCENLKNSLINFAVQRNDFLRKIYKKEKEEYENIHSKIEVKKEIYDFIVNNATKEFPMIKLEFCPLKYNNLNQNVKSKCPKFPDSAFPKIYKAIKKFFEDNKVFKEELPDKIRRSNTDFLTNFFAKRTSKDIISQEEEKEDKEFIEKYITDLFANKNPLLKVDDNKKDSNKDKNKSIINNQLNQKDTDKYEDKDKEINKDIKKEEEKKENNKNNPQKPVEDAKPKEANIIKEKVDDTKETQNPETKKEVSEGPKENKESQKEEKIQSESEEEEDYNPRKNNIHYYFEKDNPNYLQNTEILIKKLSYLRSKGFFQIQENTYNTILSLFFIILNQETKDYYILKNLLILSQTFYKIDKDNKKAYLQEGLKNFKLLKEPETWHRVINYSMNLSCSSMDLTQPTDDKIEKINKESNVIVMAYLCDIKQFCDEEKVFNEVKDYYVKVYNMDENVVNKEVENYINSLKNNESKVKEKHIKIEEKIKNENEPELYNDIDNLIGDESSMNNKKRSFSTFVNIKANNNKLSRENDINKEIIKEQDQEQEQDEEISSNKDNKEINKEISDNQNQNQIINNNINIIKIEAKEVYIMDNSKDKINIEQIKPINKDNNNKTSEDEIKNNKGNKSDIKDNNINQQK